VLPIVGIATEGWVVRRAPTLVRLLRGRPAGAPSMARTMPTEGAALDHAGLSSPMGSLAQTSLAAQPITNDEERAQSQMSAEMSADSGDWRAGS
jgi:hypothetical protein